MTDHCYCSHVCLQKEILPFINAASAPSRESYSVYDELQHYFHMKLWKQDPVNGAQPPSPNRQFILVSKVFKAQATTYMIVAMFQLWTKHITLVSRVMDCFCLVFLFLFNSRDACSREIPANFQQVLGGQSFPGKSCFYLWGQRETSGAPAGSGVVWGMPANLHSAGLWSHVLLIDIKTVSHNLIRKIHVSSEMTTLVTLRVICLHPSCTKKQIQVLCLRWCPSKAMSCFLHTTSSQQTFLEYKHVILEELNYLCNLDWLQTLFHAIDCDNGTNKTQT